jgi:hypothetical protein
MPDENQKRIEEERMERLHKVSTLPTNSILALILVTLQDIDADLRNIHNTIGYLTAETESIKRKLNSTSSPLHITGTVAVVNRDSEMGLTPLDVNVVRR